MSALCVLSLLRNHNLGKKMRSVSIRACECVSERTATTSLQLHGQREGGDDGNGRGTTNAHRLDAVKGLFTRRNLIIVVLVRQPQLVEHVQPATAVLDGLEAGHCCFFLFHPAPPRGFKVILAQQQQQPRQRVETMALRWPAVGRRREEHGGEKDSWSGYQGVEMYLHSHTCTWALRASKI